MRLSSADRKIWKNGLESGIWGPHIGNVDENQEQMDKIILFRYRNWELCSYISTVQLLTI